MRSEFDRPKSDEIADRVDRGENISYYSSDNLTVVRPVRRINIDLTGGILRAAYLK